jgi:hypothetical protein
MLTPEQQGAILKLAREAITECILRRREIAPPGDEYMRQPSGAFVTLKIDHELRGCIGFPEARYPLGETIVKAAIYAATEDPRFPRLDPGELQHVSLEVSVLTPARPVADPQEIEVGKHGLILTLGRRRGLLLPQVPLEHNWDRDEYLKHICRKAGLPDDAWKDAEARLEVFTAEVFGEEPAGA